MNSFGSKNGFQTKVWGPYAWFFLHTATLNFSTERKRGYMCFFKSLADVLPCGSCRENYKKIISASNPNPKLRRTSDVFKSRGSGARWLFRVHVQVQRDIYDKTGNPRDKPKYADTKRDFVRAMGEYERFRASCSKNAYGCVTPKKGYVRQRSVITVVPQETRCTPRRSGRARDPRTS